MRGGPTTQGYSSSGRDSKCYRVEETLAATLEVGRLTTALNETPQNKKNRNNTKEKQKYVNI